MTEDTLELRTKSKAAGRPAATRLVKPGGRRPDWLAALGSKDREGAPWGCVIEDAAVAASGAGGA